MTLPPYCPCYNLKSPHTVGLRNVCSTAACVLFGRYMLSTFQHSLAAALLSMLLLGALALMLGPVLLDWRRRRLTRQQAREQAELEAIAHAASVSAPWSSKGGSSEANGARTVASGSAQAVRPEPRPSQTSAERGKGKYGRISASEPRALRAHPRAHIGILSMDDA